jgi:hypothetical protein
VVAWSSPKAKSRRPCIIKTGVFTPFSFWIDERAAVKSATPALLPEKAASRIGSTDGSNEVIGFSLRNAPITPDFARPWGTSAVARFVHVSHVSTAAHGTPATSEFQTAPPP